MWDKEHHLSTIIPYRMRAIHIAWLASRHVLNWGEAKALEMVIEGRVFVRGLTTAWTNSAIESGIIHCRASLDFLGIKLDGRCKLVNRDLYRCGDDVGIEHFVPDGLLKVRDALACYQGDAGEAERALASVIHSANKGLAHFTSGLISDLADIKSFEIAARGVPQLLASRLYVRLGLPIPKYEVLTEPQP